MQVDALVRSLHSPGPRFARQGDRERASSTVPFSCAIGGEPAVGNSWPGYTVKITAITDPGNDVPGSNDIATSHGRGAEAVAVSRRPGPMRPYTISWSVS
jgi:hypothetical protein